MSASPLLIFHIAAGGVGILSGAAAMAYRKGSPRHRLAGNIFFASMLIMSLAGAYIAFVKDARLSWLNGLLTAYLVGTAWHVVKRKPGESGWFEWAAAALALALTYGLISSGMNVAQGIKSSMHEFPAAMYFVFGGIAGIAGLCDIMMCLRGGLRGPQRIVRHLWRMCFAMFMATSSFFLGQARQFPDAVRDSHVLVLPVIAVVLVSAYWFIRTQLQTRSAKTSLESIRA